MRLARSWRLRRGTWLGAGAVVLAFPAMFISRRFVRFLFDYHNDAMLMLQWVPGVGVLLGSLASRRTSAPAPPLYENAAPSLRRSRDRRHQPRSGIGGRDGRVPARPLLSAERGGVSRRCASGASRPPGSSGSSSVALPWSTPARSP